MNGSEVVCGFSFEFEDLTDAVEGLGLKLRVFGLRFKGCNGGIRAYRF